MNGIGIEPLRNAQDGLKVLANNIERAPDPNAIRIDNKFVERDGISVTRQSVAAWDDNTIKHIADISASASAAEKIQQVLHSLVDTVSMKIKAAGIETTTNTLSNALNQFFTAAKNTVSGFTNGYDGAALQNFLIQSNNLCESFSQVYDKISALRLDVDRGIGSDVGNINKLLVEIYKVNQSLKDQYNSNKTASLGLLEKHLKELGAYLKLKINFGADNDVLISNYDGTVLVDKFGYAQLAYFGLDTQSQDSQNIVPRIEYRFATLNNTNNINYTPEIIPANSAMFASGIGAATKLRDVTLRDALDTIKNTANSIADNVNKIHNSGSTFPPKTILTGATKVSLNDNRNWNGVLRIDAVTSDGSKVDTTSGPIRPITIDLQHLQGQFGEGNLTTQDIINEINAFLDSGMLAERVSLGTINDQNNAQIPNQYLLNNIQLAARGNVVGGNFAFDLELDGNSICGSNVQILSVTPSAGALVSQLPQQFRMEQGDRKRTNQSILLSGVNAITDVDVQIRVIGDNGQVNTGTVRFAVNPTLITTNKRVTGTIVGVVGPGNNMLQPVDLIAGTRLITRTPVAIASLVNENGTQITDNNTAGFLQVSGYGVGLVMDSNKTSDLGPSANNGTGNTLSQFFRFNDFFVNNESGIIKVNPTIGNDIRNIALGDITQGSDTTTIKTGDKTASLAIQFMAPIANGDSVIVDGTTFTFNNPGPGPFGPNDILIGADLQASLRILVTNINARNNMLVSATSNADTITLTAKNAGSAGNVISTQASVQTTMTQGGGPPAPVPANTLTALAGGTDKDMQLTIYSSRIGQNSIDVINKLAKLDKLAILGLGGDALIPQGNMTLGDLVSRVTESFIAQLNNANTESDLQTQTLNGVVEQLHKNTGINMQEEFMKMQNLNQYMQAIHTIAKMILNSTQRIINSIGG